MAFSELATRRCTECVRPAGRWAGLVSPLHKMLNVPVCSRCRAMPGRPCFPARAADIWASHLRPPPSQGAQRVSDSVLAPVVAQRSSAALARHLHASEPADVSFGPRAFCLALVAFRTVCALVSLSAPSLLSGAPSFSLGLPPWRFSLCYSASAIGRSVARHRNRASGAGQRGVVCALPPASEQCLFFRWPRRRLRRDFVAAAVPFSVIIFAGFLWALRLFGAARLVGCDAPMD